MTKNDKLNICKNHAQPFMYAGDECPWCSFAAEVVLKLQTEYKRGFGDGVKAADTEYARQQAIAKTEEKNAKCSDDSKKPSKADASVPADVPKK